MDKRTVYDTFTHLEAELTEMLEHVSHMKKSMDELIEQNVSLELENKHLRERLLELSTPESQKEKQQALSKSRLNLEKLYEDGFHVCNVCFGSRRENNEECAFCLDMIYGERK